MASDVKVTISGDSSSLEKSFRDVGVASSKMAGDLASSEGKAKSFGSSMDSVGGSVGNAEGKFMGAADLLDGLGGAFGLPTEAATGMFRAFGDLSGGFEVVQGLFTSVVGKLGALTGVTAAQTAATGAGTAAQTGLNTALLANPIGLVVIAIVALIAIFVLAWKNSETFRDIVKGAFAVIKGAAEGFWNFLKGLPEMIGGLGSRLVDIITWPYRTAFNLIARIWNSTVGKLSFEIPGWVPGLGGKGFSMPKLPEFHAGGVVPGRPGQEVPILAMAGETVTPAGGGGAGGVTINVYGSVTSERRLIDTIHEGLLNKQRRTPLGLAT